jgi:nucleoside-diphosphate-sugar epimerase
MRVFITGGTGFIGSAVVRELVAAGHEVTGLCRSDAAMTRLAAMGAASTRGELHDPSSFAAVAERHDAIVHAAFDYSREGITADRAALEALLYTASDADRPRALIYTSGVWVLGNTGPHLADEDASTAGAAEVSAWRPAHERLALEENGPRLAVAVLRPGMVYGGRGGLLDPMFETATKEGAAAFVGEGKNRWSLVHRHDLARLYRLILEKGGTGIFHGVDGVPLPLHEIARLESLAAGKGGATRSIPLDEARKRMGAMADALALDQAAIGRRAVDLGWRPEHPSFTQGVHPYYQEWLAG